MANPLNSWGGLPEAIYCLKSPLFSLSKNYYMHDEIWCFAEILPSKVSYEEDTHEIAILNDVSYLGSSKCPFQQSPTLFIGALFQNSPDFFQISFANKFPECHLRSSECAHEIIVFECTSNCYSTVFLQFFLCCTLLRCFETSTRRFTFDYGG